MIILINSVPKRILFDYWIRIVLREQKAVGEISIHIVDVKESAALNEQYRGKQGPTNVLAFPLHDQYSNLLGDLVLCAPIVKQEAFEQGKPVVAHWAHLVIHGILHLLGYDHIDSKQAEVMESLEVYILSVLGYPNPYE